MNRRATPTKPKPQRKRPPRKPTFVVRKEEKQRLERELARLQAQWLALQAEEDAAGSPASPASVCVSSPSPSPPVAAREEHHAWEDAAANPTLAVVRDRHLAFMGLRSLLSTYLSTPQAIATTEPICLPLGATARRVALLRASGPSLQQARRSVLERCRFLDLLRPHLATEWVERDDQSMCLLQLDVTPFRGVRCSVKDVYDATSFYVQNVEILVSERVGHLTLREDDEVEPAGGCVTQRRLMSTTNYGITIDANVAVFRQHADTGACAELPQEHAILSTQSVHSDELYPYQADRVRYDHDSAVLVQQVRASGGEPVTTLVRMVTFTRHSSHGAHPIALENEAPLRTLSMQWWDLMLLFVHEHVQASAGAASPMTSDVDSP